MSDPSIIVRVQGVALDAATRSPTVILGDKDGRVRLPIRVGPSEASAIIIELEEIRPTLPLTHDIVMQLFFRHRFKFDRLEIYDFDGGTYSARIRYRKFPRSYSMEVRPSDGIALALRFGAPIRVNESLSMEASRSIIDFASFIANSDEYLFLNAAESSQRSI
jgi:uncharacterized protein